jgi:hypothetical protein
VTIQKGWHSQTKAPEMTDSIVSRSCPWHAFEKVDVLLKIVSVGDT